MPGSPASRRIVAALAAAWSLGARAQDVSARGDVSYASEDTSGWSSSFLRQRYELQFSHPVSGLLRYLALVRVAQDDGERATVGDGTFRLRSRDLASRVQLSWMREDFGFDARYELEYSGSFDGLKFEDPVQRMQRAGLHGTYALTRAAAIITAFEHLDTLTSALGTSSSDDRMHLGAQLDVPGLRIVEDNQIHRAEDLSSSYLSYSPRLEADYQRTLGKDGALSARYTADFSWTEQRALRGTISQSLIEVLAVAGLYVQEPTPDAPGTPLLPDAALVDRNYTASAGIVVGGPEALSFQNVGLDMGRVVQLDRLRVNVRTSRGDVVTRGGPVVWRTYWSNDNVRWTPAGGDASQFDATLSAYEITFLPTSARYFKTVNFGVAAEDAAVTELQAFHTSTLESSKVKRWTALLHSVSAGVSVRPWEQLGFSYYGIFNADGTAFSGESKTWVLDSLHSLSASIGPFGQFRLQLGHNRWDAWFPNAPLQRSIGTIATAWWRPAPQAEVALEARNGELRANYLTAVTNAAGLHGRVQLYDLVRLSANGEYGRQRVLAGGPISDYVTASGAAALRARPDLELASSVQLQRTVFERGDATVVANTQLLQIIQYERYQAEVTYTPTNQLNLQARLGYLRGSGGEGLLQSYRGRWDPFRGAAVQLGFDVDQEVDPLTGARFSRIAVFPRWNVNRYAVLQLNYTVTRGSGVGPNRQDLLYLTFSIRT